MPCGHVPRNTQMSADTAHDEALRRIEQAHATKAEILDLGDLPLDRLPDELARLTFGDRIILDQTWALEAIYTLFHRENTLPKLRRDGRFTRRGLDGAVPGRPGCGGRAAVSAHAEVVREHRRYPGIPRRPASPA